MSTDTLLACVAIGICAALAAMTWPFRRGPLGIAIELAAGTGGSVGAAAVSHLFAPARSPLHLLFATAGAMAALVLAHGLWLVVAARAHRQHLGGGPPE